MFHFVQKRKGLKEEGYLFKLDKDGLFIPLTYAIWFEFIKHYNVDIELKMKKDKDLMDEIKYILATSNPKSYRLLDRIDFKKDGDGNFIEIKITFFPANGGK